MNKTIKTISIALLVTLLAGTMAFVLPNGTVAAASPQESTTPTVSGVRGDLIKARLEAQYSRLQGQLTTQADNIAKLSDLTTRAQARIDALTAKGVDVSSLEAALTTFEGKIPAIQSEHDNAASILASHAGFGDDGKVINITTARSTLVNAREALKSTRDLMRSAASDLRHAIRDFRAANPKQTTAPNQTPVE
jgi:hypothetical protein